MPVPNEPSCERGDGWYTFAGPVEVVWLETGAGSPRMTEDIQSIV